MRSSDAEVGQIARILAGKGDEESIARFITLGSLRYDRSQLQEMLGESKMGLVEAILEGSSLVREVKDEAREEGRKEGLEEGREKGLEEGQAAGLRRSLRIALKSRFPGLEAMPEIQWISAVGTLESLLEIAISASDRGIIERSIVRAAHSTGS
jgi:hypothetical protein